MTHSRTLLHKLLLTRRLFDMAKESLASSNEISQSIGVNLMQDSVECFLLAVCEFLNADIGTNVAFDKYFVAINEKVKPKELPFKQRLIALNKLRVNSKHFGLSPAQNETEGLPTTVREFFEEVSSGLLGMSFSTVSLVDLLREGEAKSLMHEAEKSYVEGDYEACLVSCRKAIFVRLESFYDVRPYSHSADGRGFGLLDFGNKAPPYAKNKSYVDKYVKNPIDYIVLDHQDIEMTLMKDKIDSTSFWNVWRLTPPVYREKADAPWSIKRQLDRVDPDGIKDRAEYVLDTTISLLVASDQRMSAARMAEPKRYFIELNREEVPVFAKADAGSEVLLTTPKGLRKVFVNYSVTGLSDMSTYWHAFHYEEDAQFAGYISALYVGAGN